MIDSRLGCVSTGNPCEPGEFCNEQAMRCDGCAQDEDCDDGVPCTGDRCVGGHCTFEAVDANCPDDGLFCNGSPRCDLSAGCVGGVPPCPAAACDEDQDRCGCAASTDCDDGLFCNGAEVCELAQCVPGVAPCKRCDEQHGACLRCRSDGDCDDSFFCNGLETCNIADGTCQPGEDPCPMLRCNEASSDCTECLSDSDCDDGLFCNGLETCAAPSCLPGTAPCPGACLEDSDACGPPKKDRPRSPPELPADADEDGVADDADQCPQTPLEEDADEAGCAPSQLDQADGPAACGTGVLGAGSALCLLLCPARRLRRRTVSIGGGANQREMCVMRKSDAFGLRIVLLAAVTASAVGGCGGSSEPPAQREPVSFSADIQPILNARCVVCHSPGGEAVEEGIPQDLRAAAAYADLVNQPSVLRPDLVLVVPGDASASLLYLKVSSDTPPVGEPMPSGVQRLSAAQIDQIRQWIDEGALEN
jgi:hypothetical protein